MKTKIDWVWDDNIEFMDVMDYCWRGGLILGTGLSLRVFVGGKSLLADGYTISGDSEEEWLSIKVILTEQICLFLSQYRPFYSSFMSSTCTIFS